MSGSGSEGSRRQDADSDDDTGDTSVADDGGKDDSAAKKVTAPAAMRKARQQLAELLDRAPESVSALRRADSGWEAHVEVVEVERIPDSTSVLASYRVLLDADGELTEYERVRRYARGQLDRG